MPHYYCCICGYSANLLQLMPLLLVMLLLLLLLRLVFPIDPHVVVCMWGVPICQVTHVCLHTCFNWELKADLKMWL